MVKNLGCYQIRHCWMELSAWSTGTTTIRGIQNQPLTKFSRARTPIWIASSLRCRAFWQSSKYLNAPVRLPRDMKRTFSKILGLSASGVVRYCGMVETYIPKLLVVLCRVSYIFGDGRTRHTAVELESKLCRREVMIMVRKKIQPNMSPTSCWRAFMNALVRILKQIINLKIY